MRYITVIVTAREIPAALEGTEENKSQPRAPNAHVAIHRSAPREGLWGMAIEQFVICTVECVHVPITAQYSVTCYQKYVINGKIQQLSVSGE